MTPRSHLYVAGDNPARFAKAVASGADAIILDLEDAVAEAGKDRARAEVARWVGQWSGSAPQIWVRVNSGPRRGDDIAAVVGAGAGLTGICVPKVGDADELVEVDRLIGTAEQDAGLPIGSVVVAPLIETAAGLLAAREIARAPRVAFLHLGEADLAADLGVQPGHPDDAGTEFLYARSLVVTVSAAAGIGPPVAPVTTDFRDLDALSASTGRLHRLGYLGRACIHPAQIATVNAVFTPEPDEIRRAQDLVDRLTAARDSGAGVTLDANGRMIDEAVIRSARRTLGLVRAQA